MRRLVRGGPTRVESVRSRARKVGCLWWWSASRRLYTRRADESWGIARRREASTSVVAERDVGSSETEVAKGGKDGSDGGLQRVPVGVYGESARRANATRVSLADVLSVIE